MEKLLSQICFCQSTQFYSMFEFCYILICSLLGKEALMQEVEQDKNPDCCKNTVGFLKIYIRFTMSNASE